MERKNSEERDEIIRQLKKEKIIIEKEKQIKDMKNEYNNIFYQNEKNKKDLASANTQIKSIIEENKKIN